MPIFSVIDTGATGDTVYEAEVKNAANWAITETEITNARGGTASINTRLTTDETNIGNKAASSHTHGASSTVYSIVAAEANLDVGATDGEQKICSTNGNRYMWEAGSAKWQPESGNQYATASLPAGASYNILTGTRVYDTTLARMKYYNGSAWILDDTELRRSFLL